MKRSIALRVAALCLIAAPALAQSEYPNRAIKVIVPIPAGAAGDHLARIYAAGLQEKWKQPVTIENRVGASHNIGADAFSRASPDGYTLFTAPPPSFGINQFLFPKLTYDPTTFVPLTVMAEVPNVLVVRPGLDARDVAAVIAMAKANPGKYTYGSTGKGSTLHLSAEAFRSMAGVDLLHIPYTGVTQLISEMLAGRVDVAFMNLIDVFPHLGPDRLRPLGVGIDQRSPELPDTPTIAETLPGYHSTAWFAVAAPPKTPPQLAEKISVAIRETFRLPEGQQLLKNLHATGILNTPAEAAVFIREDTARWKDVILKNKIVGE